MSEYSTDVELPILLTAEICLVGFMRYYWRTSRLHAVQIYQLYHCLNRSASATQEHISARSQSTAPSAKSRAPSSAHKTRDNHITFFAAATATACMAYISLSTADSALLPDNIIRYMVTTLRETCTMLDITTETAFELKLSLWPWASYFQGRRAGVVWDIIVSDHDADPKEWGRRLDDFDRDLAEVV